MATGTSGKQGRSEGKDGGGGEEGEEYRYWRCWSCGEPIGQSTGIDLRGQPGGAGGGPGSAPGVDLQVCLACWSAVPVWARLAIGLAFRGRVAGGVGIHEAAWLARQVIAEFRGWMEAMREAEGE